jgi:hypothetical protein
MKRARPPRVPIRRVLVRLAQGRADRLGELEDTLIELAARLIGLAG